MEVLVTWSRVLGYMEVLVTWWSVGLHGGSVGLHGRVFGHMLGLWGYMIIDGNVGLHAGEWWVT